MYSDVFRMYPRARVGKPSDTIKIQHARCEYKRILAHEGSMTLRYKVPYTIQARYKQDTVEYRCIPDVATGYSQDTSKIQSNTHVSQMYPRRRRRERQVEATASSPSQPSSAHVWPSPTPAMRRRSACWPLGSRASRAGAMRRIRRGYEIFFVFRPYLEVLCATCGDTHERMYPVVSCCIPVYPRGARVGPCVRVWIRVS